MTTTAPPRLPIPGGLQLSVRFSQNGQDAVCVLGGYRASGFTQPAGAQAWLNEFWARFKHLAAPSVVVVGGTCRDVSGPDGTVHELSAPASAAGTATNPSNLVAQSTFIKWSTATGGRTGKGRTFLPGLPTVAIAADGRSYLAAHGPAVQAACAAYIGSSVMAAEAIQPAVLSFRRGLARPITAGALAPLVGLQRRRMR